MLLQAPVAMPRSSPAARWRRLLSAGLAVLMTLGSWQLPAQAQVRLPSLGESASEDLSIGAERRIGEQIMREARRDPEFLDDPVLQEYLQSLFSPLVSAARQLGNIDADTDQAFAWEPFLVKDRSVNAFALPGGFVGVHLGLIAITTTRDQLASVLAHELSHVTQRHIARSIAPSSRASMIAIATLLLGIIAASKSNNPDVFNAAVMGGQGAAIQSQLNFSRDMEREADRIGYGLLANAGYAPSGMASMFEKLDVASRINDSGGFPYLRSHPLTTDRISEARNRTLIAPGAPAVPTLLHAMMQMRSRVLMAEGAQALQRLAGGGTSPLRAERVAALYGGALAASMLNEHAAAEAQAAQALQLEATISPREPQAERALRLLQAEVRLAAGRPAAAQLALDALPAGAAAERPPLLLRAQIALALRRADPNTPADTLRASTEALQTWLADAPHDAAAWELLASTSEVLGLKLRAMRAAAEARVVLGDLTGAIDRLRAAQGVSRAAVGQDFIEASVIDARLRQITAQRRQLALEARGEGRSSRPGPGDEPP
jgi:predicted Zn-dependent protease